MPLSVFIQSYRELRRPVFHWTVGLLVLAGLILLSFPLLDAFIDLDWLGLQDSASFLFGYEPGMLKLSHIGAWVEAAGFGLFFPLLAAVYAGILGSWLVAGEEERGSLGLLLAAPVSRWQFMLEKSAVLVVTVLRPVLVLGLVLLLISRLGVPVTNLAGRVLSLFLLALVYGSLALAIGSFSGRRRLSLGITLAGLVLGFALSRLPGSLPAGHFLRLFSPVYYYEAAPAYPLFFLALLGLALVFLGVAWAGFERRDLAV